MADVLHLRCNHCGVALKNSPWPYCQPCNLDLCYRALPILLGMLLTNPAGARSGLAPAWKWAPTIARNRKPYPHLNEILD